MDEFRTLRLRFSKNNPGDKSAIEALDSLEFLFEQQDKANKAMAKILVKAQDELTEKDKRIADLEHMWRSKNLYPISEQETLIASLRGELTELRDRADELSARPDWPAYNKALDERDDAREALNDEKRRLGFLESAAKQLDVTQARIEEAARHHSEHHDAEAQDLMRVADAEARIEELREEVKAHRRARRIFIENEDAAREVVEAARMAVDCLTGACPYLHGGTNDDIAARLRTALHDEVTHG